MTNDFGIGGKCFVLGPVSQLHVGSQQAIDQAVFLVLCRNGTAAKQNETKNCRPAHTCTLPNERRDCKANFALRSATQRHSQLAAAGGRSSPTLQDFLNRDRTSIILLVGGFAGGDHGAFERNSGEKHATR